MTNFSTNQPNQQPGQEVAVPRNPRPYTTRGALATAGRHSAAAWGRIGSSATLLVEQAIERLQHHYRLVSPLHEVGAFLLAHLSLASQLEGIAAMLRQYFPAAEPTLRVRLDGAPQWFEAIIAINPSRPYREASAMLERFDTEWWFAAMERTDGHITITLR